MKSYRPSEKRLIRNVPPSGCGGASLAEVLAAMMILAAVLSGLVAVLLRGAASLRSSEVRAEAVAAVENLAEGIRSNPVYLSGRNGVRRDYSHYLARPAPSCADLPDNGSDAAAWAAFHLCRLKNDLDGLPNVRAAFAVCRDTSGKMPEFTGASPQFHCNGRGGGVVVKAVWRPQMAQSDGETFHHWIYLAE